MKTSRLPWAARPPSWPEVLVIALAWLLGGCCAALPAVVMSSYVAGQVAAANMPDSIERKAP